MMIIYATYCIIRSLGDSLLPLICWRTTVYQIGANAEKLPLITIFTLRFSVHQIETNNVF